MNIELSLIRKTKPKTKEYKTAVIISIVYLIIYILVAYIIDKNVNITNTYTSFKKAVSVLLTYLIMLEIDPDHMYNRLISQIVCGLCLVNADFVAITTPFYILVISRFLTKSSGVYTKYVEYILLCFYAMIMFFIGNYIYTLYIAIAMIYDYIAKDSRIMSFLIGIGFFIISIQNFFKMYATTSPDIKIWQIAIITIVEIIYALRLSFLKRVLTKDDKDNRHISAKRLKTSNVIMSIFILINYLSFGKFYILLPAIIPMTQSAIPYIRDMIMENK